MEAVFHILWFLGFCLSIVLVFTFVGSRGIANMFPEAKRWYDLPTQIGSLAFFALMVLVNPFI